MTKEADFGVPTWISQNLAIEYVIFKSSRVVQFVHRLIFSQEDALVSH